MDKKATITNIDDFLTVQEAARELGLTDKSIQRHVKNGVLKGTKKGGRYLISREEVEHFRPRLAGRPRQSVPQWRFSHEENRVIVTTVEAELREGVEEGDFVRVLEQVKRDERYLFQGTIARYVLSNEETPRLVQFFLVWRQTAMPSAFEIEQELAGLRAALSEVLHWEKVAYRTHRVWMHT